MAAVSGTAFAQSSVTLYGIVDVGFGSSTTKDATGATTDKSTGMVNGVQSGSRWGVRGTEDLGGGLKASFNLESAVGVNDGTGNDSFARRSVVELAGGFGKVGLGRDYTPTFSLIAGTDVTGTDASTTSNYYPAGVRANNMIMYTSPSFAGVVAKIAVHSEKSGAPGNSNRISDVDTSFIYSNGPLMAGIAFGSGDITTAATDKVPNSGALDVPGTTNKVSHTVIGGTYDLGMAKLFANLVNNKDKISNVKRGETNFGASMPLGATTVLIGFGTNNGTSAAGVKSKGNDFVLGANYSLSKRTNLYARYNTREEAVATGDAPKSTNMRVGVRHIF